MLRAVKGMNDLLPEEMPLWRHIEETARGVAELFGFQEIRTPLLERSELFSRGVGESTDIVEKEMYAFTDKGGEHLALRPEGTASVVRAFIQHKLYASNPEARLYYLGPMYRRERPQKGRFRQFYQFGVEAFGEASGRLDAEVMAMLHHFLQQVGIKDVVIKVNCLGDAEDRPRYLQALSAYLQQHKESLCDDCRRRMDRAPLRVLDCKNPQCRDITDAGPQILDHLGADSLAHFDQVRHSLDLLQIPYQVNPRIVRGLDYYTRTVFEAVSEGLGSQNAICGGGRYNALVEQLGGPATPAVGYAQGIERLAMLLQDKFAPRRSVAQLAIIPFSDAERDEAQKMAFQLRQAGIACSLDLAGRSVKAQLRRANRQQADYAIVLGPDELAQAQVQLKFLREKREVLTLAISGLAQAVTDTFNKENNQ